MTPRELLCDLPLGPGDTRHALLHARLFVSYLADHVYTAELADGGKLRDAMDFTQWLRELADEARKLLANGQNTEVSPVAERSTCRKVTAPAQPRYSYDPTCPRCGHVHEGVAECGMQMGNGRVCRCEMEAIA
jgi:hypothetical protein